MARLQQLADTGCVIGFEGFVPLEFGAPLPVTLDVLAQLERAGPVADELGLRLRRPSRLPPTMRAHAVSVVADAHDLGASWRARCYRAFWEDGADLADPEVLATLAEGSGLERAWIAPALQTTEPLRILRERMNRRRGQGAGGVPLLDANGTLVSAEISDDEVRQLAAL